MSAAALVAAGLALSVAASAPSGPSGQALALSVLLRPQLLDYEVPGHPHQVGESQVGFVLRPFLVYEHDRFLRVEAGVLLRWALAQDFGQELGAFPHAAVILTPFGPEVSLRLGSLDLRHGFHPGVLDEARYAYGRPYQRTYNQGLVAAARRDLGGDPFLPVENGAQLVAESGGLRAEVYLDWQLVDTAEHREKFAVGLLGSYRSEWLELGAQYRLLHYGGQQFTATDPLRSGGLDPKRQPTTLAVLVRLKPLRLGPISFELPLAFLHGRMIQRPGEAERQHFGLEPGLDLVGYGAVRLGYRLWLPNGDEPAFVSEDGDPVYSGPTSHRISVESRLSFGAVELAGRLDVVVPDGGGTVQTLSLLYAELRFEPELWRAARLP